MLQACARPAWTAVALRGHQRQCAASCAQALPGLQTLGADVDTFKVLRSREKEIMGSLRQSNKRVKCLAKEMKKAATGRKPALLVDMKAAVQEVEASRASWAILVDEMIAAGLEGCEGSSDEDEPKRKDGKLDGKAQAARSQLAAEPATCLQTLERGSVTVCTGKACAGPKGQSGALKATLTQHYQGSPSIKVEESGCVGYCKQCANVLVFNADTAALDHVAQLEPEQLAAMLERTRVLAAA